MKTEEIGPRFFCGYRIKQIMPADGVVAVFDDGKWPVICWALIENIEGTELDEGPEKSLRTSVVGMIMVDRCNELEPINHLGSERLSRGFIRYE